MNSIVKSWKTTVGGILAAVGVILVQFDIFTEDQAQELVGAITTIVGIVLATFSARDNKVSSERAGAE